MKVVILGSRSGWHEARLGRALGERGADPVVAPVTALAASVGGGARLTAAGLPLDECGAVFVRAIPSGSLEQVIFRIDALHRLARLGVPVLNSPRCVERSVDKYFTSTLLEDAGIPTPRTRVCERVDDALAAFEALGGDVVIKPLFGSDISHFDVVDATETVEEAWELVERGLLTSDDFREFTFTNAVHLYQRMNPSFFAGTVVEASAAAVFDPNRE